jgi:hypothetical protein
MLCEWRYDDLLRGGALFFGKNITLIKYLAYIVILAGHSHDIVGQCDRTLFSGRYEHVHKVFERSLWKMLHAYEKCLQRDQNKGRDN